MKDHKHEHEHEHEHEYEHEHEHEHEHECCCHDHDHGHSCHDHEHGHCCHEGEDRKTEVIKLIISAVLFAAALLVEHVFKLHYAVYLILYIAAFAAVGFDVIKTAVKRIIKKDIFNECTLMTVASVGAFFTGSFSEASAVMILYSFGELLQDLAVDKSRDSIETLINVMPKDAEVYRDGETVEIPASEVKVGDTVIVRPGRSVAVDGVIKEGSASFDTSAITGESFPRGMSEGDRVMSGYIALDGEIKLEATAEYDNSAAARIASLIEGAEAKKAKTESFITKFAKIYTPVVLILAVIVAILPPVFDQQWKTWIHRALTFLVVSCPCALVISVPLTFFAGVGAASRSGILVKGTEYLEALSKIDIFAFDKTGTLTKGTFAVSEIHAEKDKAELINVVCSAEAHSDHPIAKALSSLEYEALDVSELKEMPGEGIVCNIDGKQCAIGNTRLMKRYGIELQNSLCTAVHACRDGEYLGYITLKDEAKNNAAEAVGSLKSLGVKKTVMLSGDAKAAAESTANEVGLDEVYAELLPEQKTEEVEKLLAEGKVAYVGDGINDAAVLARADVGVAMGALGSDTAIEAADVVLTDDNVAKLPKAIKISKKTVSIARQNIIFAIAVKVIILALSFFGITDIMWLAVFADTGVALLCAANAMRAMKCR